MIIYKTTNLIDKRSYVGKDIHNNPSYLGSGRLLRRAIKKSGKESWKDLIVREKRTKAIQEAMNRPEVKERIRIGRLHKKEEQNQIIES